jgi:hypothetical protein
LSQIVNVSMTVDQICHFVDRFAYEPWTSLFKLFEKHFGLYRLTGCMAFFQQNPGLIVGHPILWVKIDLPLTRSQDSLTNTIKSLHQSYKSTYRPLLKDRFHDMPFMAKSNLSEVAARACDFVTVCSEYRQIDYFMDRYEKAGQFPQDSVDEGKSREQGDGLSVGILTHSQLLMLIKLTQGQVEQYQLCRKRLTDLARALRDYNVTVDPDKRDQGAVLPDLRVDEYRPDLVRIYDPRTYLPPSTALYFPTIPTKKRKTAPAPERDEAGSETDNERKDGKRSRKDGRN